MMRRKLVAAALLAVLFPGAFLIPTKGFGSIGPTTWAIQNDTGEIMDHQDQSEEVSEENFFEMLGRRQGSEWERLNWLFSRLVEQVRGGLVKGADNDLKKGQLTRLVATSEGLRWPTINFPAPLDHKDLADDAFNHAVLKTFVKILLHYNRTTEGLTSEELKLFKRGTIDLLVNGQYKWPTSFSALLWTEIRVELWTQARGLHDQVRFDESELGEEDQGQTEVEQIQKAVRRAVENGPSVHMTPPDVLEQKRKKGQAKKLVLALIRKAGAAPCFALRCQYGLGFQKFSPDEVRQAAVTCGFPHQKARKIAARARLLSLSGLVADGLSRQQIAALLDVSVSQVARYLDRAKAMLKSAMPNEQGVC